MSEIIVTGISTMTEAYQEMLERGCRVWSGQLYLPTRARAEVLSHG